MALLLLLVLIVLFATSEVHGLAQSRWMTGLRTVGPNRRVTNYSHRIPVSCAGAADDGGDKPKRKIAKYDNLGGSWWCTDD